jgi:ribosome biogenesis protein UTP30
VALTHLDVPHRDTQAEYEELARTKGLPGRVTILSVSKLKSDYKPYEAKRQLCQSFDLFLADDRCVAVHCVMMELSVCVGGALAAPVCCIALKVVSPPRFVCCRVIDVLPRLLGKSFFTAKKQPIPIKISAKGGDWAAQLVKARDATYLHIGKGPCSALRVRRTQLPLPFCVRELHNGAHHASDSVCVCRWDPLTFLWPSSRRTSCW